MGVLVQIRDVDPAVRDELKARAAREGISLNTYLRRALDREVQRPTRHDVLARIAARSERSDRSVTSLVRRERDTRSGA